MSDSAPLSVSELTFRIKTVLEGGLPMVWVRGEISQFTSHRSGHWYFTLSDDRSQLACVLWRGRSENIAFTPQIGQMVIAQGKVTVYERGGRYQFDCFDVRPAGVGELALAFEALKAKLAEEGLFTLERKVALPSLPERIGLVTSLDGAALQDILKVAHKRAPWVEFRLAPTAVQGAGAAGQIAKGIRELDESGWPQIIIIGRGGGSPEDLWAFNEEVLVRAVANCCTPIVSAVGHEVDVTLSDLAADLRAPTPSAAAEMCLPDQESLRDRLEDLQGRLNRSVGQQINSLRRWLMDHARIILREKGFAIWREESQRVDDLSRCLDSALLTIFQNKRIRVDHLTARHKSLNPAAVLARGYSIVRHKGENKAITNSANLVPNEEIDVTFHQGSAEAVIKSRQLN
ncbi:MAG: exodeoxyribonuclease VII large subunit [bacterium]|nr:exodeoxyribonuclease VII large subunit [bacterium]